MPSRHIQKLYAPDTYYHVFNRGVEKRDVFLDDSDYDFFLLLLQRYLGPDTQQDAKYRQQPNYSKSVSLAAYCLMPNHFHLLLFQSDIDGMQKLMTSIGIAYSSYFNKKYKRVGKLFQSRYKAAPVQEHQYYTHISRYIHLNPLDINRNYIDYPYSSVKTWLGMKEQPSWLNIHEARSTFTSVTDYKKFLEDHIGAKAELKAIKRDLRE